MSIRIMFILIFLFILSACNNEHKADIILVEKVNRYDRFSTTERDSIAKSFNNYSNYALQPSEMHRRLKDSAILANPNPYYIDYKLVLSYSYKKVGEHIKAMELLNEAVEKDVENNSTDGLEYRAWTLLYYYRDYEGAIRDIEEIEKMTNQQYNVCWGEPCGFQKGQAYYQLTQYKKAITAFHLVNQEEEKIGLDYTSNFFIYFYLGRSYHKLKNYEEAIKNYQLVLKIDNEFSEAIFYLGKLYMETENYTKAKSFFDKAYQLIKQDKKMSEPYIERFDELFIYQVEEAMEELSRLKN